jgi:hypothetical protein
MRNEYLEKVHDMLRDALRQALATKEIYMLYHPYPVSFHGLYQAIKNLLGTPPTVAVHDHVEMPA